MAGRIKFRFRLIHGILLLLALLQQFQLGRFDFSLVTVENRHGACDTNGKIVVDEVSGTVVHPSHRKFGSRHSPLQFHIRFCRTHFGTGRTHVRTRIQHRAQIGKRNSGQVYLFQYALVQYQFPVVSGRSTQQQIQPSPHLH